MYTRLTIVHVKLDKIDEAIRIYNENVIPSAKSQPGCQGCYLLTNRKTGKGIVLTMWDTHYDASIGEQNGYYQAQLNKFAGMFVKKPVHENYEVIFQENVSTQPVLTE